MSPFICLWKRQNKSKIKWNWIFTKSCKSVWWWKVNAACWHFRVSLPSEGHYWKKKKEKKNFISSLHTISEKYLTYAQIPSAVTLVLPWKPSSFFASVKDVGKGGMKWEMHCVRGLSDYSKKQVCKEFNINRLEEGVCNISSASCP